MFIKNLSAKNLLNKFIRKLQKKTIIKITIFYN